jgi:hypothetical protein
LTNKPIQVGGISLNPKKVNPGFLETIIKATDSAELSAGKDEVKLALQNLHQNGEAPEGSLECLDDYAKSLKKQWKDDKLAIWDAKQADKSQWNQAEVDKLKHQLKVNAPFLGAYSKLANELREATALAAVQAIAGASFGPAVAVAGYAAYVNGPKWDRPANKVTTELVETYQSYLDGTSPMTTKGNSVKQVHRAELWKTLTGMTRDAAAAGAAGKPQEITAQYYELTSPELVGNLADAAKAGSKLRLNLDIGRLSYPSTDAVTGEDFFTVDDLATKSRTVLQFASIQDADVGVSIFPSKSLLGSPTDLMHRKVLRVGEKVLMSGMNGNASSGENLDAGYVLEGPAARRYTENVGRDISNSAGATLQDIWGDKHIEKFAKADLRMGSGGLVALFDSLSGPSPAGTTLPRPKTADELQALAKKANLDLASVISCKEGDFDKTVYSLLNEEYAAKLSDEGKKLLMGHIQRSVESTHSDANMKALGDVTPPSGKAVGETTVDIADSPAEREVLTLNAINQAEEFLYVPGFVLTRAVAAAIVARNEEAKAAGKPLDIRIVADSGVYPFGGTPNSTGVNFLEENGIPVRWAKLERTGSHDRKVHAKQVLTDKGEISGSTNFSKAGMRENWETSAYVRFDKDDAQAQELKAQSKAQFEQLWDNNTYALSTADLASFYAKNAPEFGHEQFVESGKGGATRQILIGIENYEVESGALVQRLVEREDVAARRSELLAAGYSNGDASLMAINQVVGEQPFRKMTAELPSSMELERMRSSVQAWKQEAIISK